MYSFALLYAVLSDSAAWFAGGLEFESRYLSWWTRFSGFSHFHPTNTLLYDFIHLSRHSGKKIILLSGRHELITCRLLEDIRPIPHQDNTESLVTFFDRESRVWISCSYPESWRKNPPELPDWAISHELGYPKVLFATTFYDGRFVNFWATRNFDERILGEQILSFFLSLFLFSQRFSNCYCVSPIWSLNRHFYSTVLTCRKYVSANFI